MTRSAIPGAPTILALVLQALAAPAEAQVPRLLGYQGRLLRADGTAATGTASVTFTVFDGESGGTPLWTETQTMGLSDGYYSTFLGLVALPPDSLFDGGARWLEIRVGSETLAPRQQIGTVSYALTARNVAGGGASVTSLKVAGQTVIDAAGRLAGSARYSAGAGLAVDDSTQTISLRSCPSGQALLHDDNTWQCVPAVTSVSVAAPLSVANGSTTPTISMLRSGAASSGYLASDDWSRFNAKYDAATQCGGDLTGNLAAPAVARLQSRPVAATAPANGQVLKWSASASQWEPAVDANSGGTVTSVTATAPLTAYNGSSTPNLSIAPAAAGSDGFLSSTDWVRFDAKYDASTACAGDLVGSYLSPQVARIQGVSVSTATPQTAQVLRFDGTRWAPASLGIADVGGLSTGYMDLTGIQSIGGSKTFTAAPEFGTPLGVASGGIGTASADANTFFAGPTDGSAQAPGFRALTVADIPMLEASKIPLLDASKIVTGTLGVSNGGTGAATFAQNGILVGNGFGAIQSLPGGSEGQLLVSGGAGVPTWTDSPSLVSGVFAAGARFTGPGAYSPGSAMVDDAGLRLQLDGAVNTSAPAGLNLAVARSSPAAAIRNTVGPALVVEAGSVGIGITSGLEGTFQVHGNQSLFENTSGSGYRGVFIQGSNADASIIGATSGGGRSRGPLAFWTGDAERLRIDASGNVGIGTSVPAAALDVAGSIRVSGTFTGSGAGLTEVAASTLRADSSAECDATHNLGIVRWNGSHFQGCNGSFWTQFDNQPPPLIETLGPASGATRGGYTLTITGKSFTNPSTVTLRGGTPMTTTFVNSTRLTLAMPSTTTAGAASVVVNGSDNQQSDPLQFTYVASGESAATAVPHCNSLVGVAGANAGLTTYWIAPGGVTAYQAVCDLTTEGGGWTLVSTKTSESYNFWSGSVNTACAAGATADCASAVHAGLSGWTTALWRFSDNTNQYTMLDRATASPTTLAYLAGVAGDNGNYSAPGWTKVVSGTRTGPFTISAFYTYSSYGLSESHSNSDQWLDLWSQLDGSNSYTATDSASITGEKCIAGVCRNATVWFMVRGASAGAQPAPTLASISPTSGSARGGFTVTVNGTNLTNGSTVRVGTGSPVAATYVSPTQLAFTMPAYASLGAATVTVLGFDGQSSGAATTFSFVASGETSARAVANCNALVPIAGANAGTTTYWISPGGVTPYQAVCDLTTEGGGWTLVGTKTTYSYNFFGGSVNYSCAAGATADCSSAIPSGLVPYTTAMWRFSDNTNQYVMLDRVSASSTTLNWLAGVTGSGDCYSAPGWTKVVGGTRTGLYTMTCFYTYSGNGISEGHHVSDQWLDLWNTTDGSNNYTSTDDNTINGCKCIAGVCRNQTVWLMVR